MADESGCDENDSAGHSRDGIGPATLEVARNACIAVAEEMNATLIRTAYSPNITERRDCSCALFGPSARLIAQAENIPVHLGAMPDSVAAALQSFPPETLSDGDAILVNDPYHGGAHLPDLTLVSPIYDEDELVAYAANRAHHADVGGGTAGSVAADATEIYQEGLRVPPVKLYDAGERNETAFTLLTTNVRTPEERLGDIRAQQAANETARRRVTELVERYGTDGFESITTAVLDYSERRMRNELTGLPDGRCEFADTLDSDGHGRRQISIRATVTIDDDTVSVDFDGTASQVSGAINAVRAVTVSATYYAIRCVTDHEIPANHGCYRPITVTTPDGSVVDATPPAAVVGGNLETSQRVADVVLGALADVVPERVTAAGQGTMNNVTFGQSHSRDRTSPVSDCSECSRDDAAVYTFYETQAGGFGGRAGRDGMDGVHVHMSNTRNTPAEVIENEYPLVVERYELRQDSGGAGEFRGGLGLRRDITPVEQSATVSTLMDRHQSQPYGLVGGAPGAAGTVKLLTATHTEPVDSKMSLTVEPGETLSIRTPGGGGYGDPTARSPEAVVEDLRNEKISAAAAREEYGVDPEQIPDELGSRRE